MQTVKKQNKKLCPLHNILDFFLQGRNDLTWVHRSGIWITWIKSIKLLKNATAERLNTLKVNATERNKKKAFKRIKFAENNLNNDKVPENIDTIWKDRKGRFINKFKFRKSNKQGEKAEETNVTMNNNPMNNES